MSNRELWGLRQLFRHAGIWWQRYYEAEVQDEDVHQPYYATGYSIWFSDLFKISNPAGLFYSLLNIT